jgi:hypothetical protein
MNIATETTTTLTLSSNELMVIRGAIRKSWQSCMATAAKDGDYSLSSELDCLYYALGCYQPLGDPATMKERDACMGRAAELIRVKLPKAGMAELDASSGVKTYLLAGTGKQSTKELTFQEWDLPLKALENATPKKAAAVVRAAVLEAASNQTDLQF